MRAVPVHIRRERILRHPCCGAVLCDVKGCTVQPYHVMRQVTTESLSEFCEASRIEDPRSKRAYALDTKMIYTTGGMEIARLSLVDEEGRVEYVRPMNPVLDYNTTFSGTVASNMESAKHNLESIRSELFKCADQSTLLVGHSQENDLTALVVVHTNVTDTSETFRYGAFGSGKWSLRELAAILLKVKIQQGSHCSVEDARACMCLMRNKM
ncbi:Protein Y56A3A.33 [Aphelenchoides avenae]|nr:Protein Y56A3A.33 [Aphelenchus avenae]